MHDDNRRFTTYNCWEDDEWLLEEEQYDDEDDEDYAVRMEARDERLAYLASIQE